MRDAKWLKYEKSSPPSIGRVCWARPGQAFNFMHSSIHNSINHFLVNERCSFLTLDDSEWTEVFVSPVIQL